MKQSSVKPQTSVRKNDNKWSSWYLRSRLGQVHKCGVVKMVDGILTHLHTDFRYLDHQRPNKNEQTIKKQTSKITLFRRHDYLNTD